MAIVSETGFIDFGKDKLFVKHIYRDDGIGDQPVLFVHGVTYSSHVFDLNFEDYSLAGVVAENGCSVWLLDLPGYANSMTEKNGFDVTVDYAALAINATVDYILSEENVEKISLFGWSMGTVTGSAFAAAFPQKVRKLILFAPIFTGLNIPTKLDSIHVNTPEHAAEDFQKLPDGTNDDSITEPNLIKAFVDQCMFFDGHGSPNGPRLTFSPA